MRCVVQRVKNANVRVLNQEIASIQIGLLVLLGVEDSDTQADVDYCAKKIANLRIFPDEDDMMNKSVVDANGKIILVSQFTLYGDCRKGNRPSFIKAAKPDLADELYNMLKVQLCKMGLEVETGQFQADMDVSLVNWGPVTILLDSKKLF